PLVPRRRGRRPPGTPGPAGRRDRGARLRPRRRRAAVLIPEATTMQALAKPVTAALRAGYAWSVRRDRPEAWTEVARMTGVIMRHLGPGRGPVTPAELVTLLRRPLGDWLPVDDPALAGLIILDADDRLTPGTYDVGCDYTVELLDPAAGWLPKWRTHRAEQVE